MVEMAEVDADLSEEEVLQSLPLVVSSTGELTAEFGFCALPIDSGARIQLAAVAVIDSKLLVAVPRSAWHKKVAQRILPQTALQKPALAEVDAVYLNGRDAEPVASLKIWMGFLEQGLLLNLQEDAEPDTLDWVCARRRRVFGSHCSVTSRCCPRTFRLYQRGRIPGSSGRGIWIAHGSTCGEVGRLGGRSCFFGCYSGEQARDPTAPTPKEAVPPLGAAPKRASAIKTPDDLHVSFSEKFPMMDASVVAAAVQGGVDEGSFQEMQKLLGAAAPAARRLKEPQTKPASSRARSSVASHLSETESEKEVLGGGTPPASPQTVEQAVTHLAEIVGVLAADKMKKKKASRLEAALDGISASGVGDPLTLGSGKKAFFVQVFKILQK